MDAELTARLSGRLSGRVAVVTGAGAPESTDPVTFGYAIASTLAASGARVVLVDRDAAALDRAVARVRDGQREVLAVQADIGSTGQCDEVARRVVDAFGTVDVLVNNAAIIGAGWDLDAPDDAFGRTMDVNWMGAVRMSRACMPHLDDRASIINIASIGADHDFGMLDYSSSKGALLSLTYAMAAKYGERGVRVNAISPGTMWSQMSQRRLEQSGATESEILEQRRLRALTVPLRRQGDGWDIALACVFLASEESQWITGQNLIVDAGLGRAGFSNGQQR